MTETQKPVFTPEAEDSLFRTARSQVLNAVLWRGTGRKGPDFEKELGKNATVPVLGTFVSFKKQGALRSCMGWMNDGAPLAEALKASAISAAREDPRFPPIDPSELDALTMEVWVLWGMKEVPETGEARLGTFEIGRHGLQIHGRGRRGLLLPGVAIEFRMTPRQFLEAVCQKAGLPKDAWLDPGTTLLTFEGLAIDRPFYDESVAQEVNEWRASHPEGKDRIEVRNLGWNLGPLMAPVTRSTPKPPESPTHPPLRPAAVAGMFYPVGREQTKMMEEWLASDPPEEPKIEARAVLVPHAGWIYSGKLAMSVLSRVKIPSRVIVFAPKHRPEGEAWGVAPNLEWDFGTGRLASDPDLADALVRAVPRFRLDSLGHRREHAIEVLLPMIARLAPETKVVGAVFGYGSEEDLFQGADQFAKLYESLPEKPLLIISSDMNHYESRERTEVLDQMALDALETLRPRTLYRVVTENNISMCGFQPACFVLEALAQSRILTEYQKVGHLTSGETSGDFDHVVGYAGYLFR